jgi:hypothetical protein
MIADNRKFPLALELRIAWIDDNRAVKNISPKRTKIRCFVRGIQELLRRWSLLC